MMSGHVNKEDGNLCSRSSILYGFYWHQFIKHRLMLAVIKGVRANITFLLYKPEYCYRHVCYLPIAGYLPSS
jgi:hypothetical protein